MMVHSSSAPSPARQPWRGWLGASKTRTAATTPLRPLGVASRLVETPSRLREEPSRLRGVPCRVRGDASRLGGEACRVRGEACRLGGEPCRLGECPSRQRECPSRQLGEVCRLLESAGRRENPASPRDRSLSSTSQCPQRGILRPRMLIQQASSNAPKAVRGRPSVAWRRPSVRVTRIRRPIRLARPQTTVRALRRHAAT